MSKFINTIAVLGDDAVVDSIIERTIPEFKDNIVTTVGSFAFSYCSKLTVVDLPKVSSIAANAFGNCSSLTVVVLRGDQLCSLANANAFNSTPIKSGTGYIYVPRALLSDTDATKDYRRATNWSTYATKFRAKEDYPDI